MNPLALFAIGLALPFAAAGLIGAGLYLRNRRRAAFAFVQGLYLESKPLVADIKIGNAFAAGTSHTNGKDAPHVCTFTPCPHLEREAERRATAQRINGGR